MLKNNQVINGILRRASGLQMPSWYLGAGCIAQTVWNLKHGFDPMQNIADYDLVYFDPTDLSEGGEQKYCAKAQSIFRELGGTIDVTNEARVHLWYEKEFGSPIQPYTSVEDAIGSRPTTATSIGTKYDESGKFALYAAFGLGDLFSMIVRANKRQVSQEVYNKKAERWGKAWPKLTVIPWESGP